MSEKWLVCSVFKGMFSDELAVKYGKSSFFVPKTSVAKTSDDAGKLKVRVFSQNRQTWAVLPTDDQAIISVDQKDLVAA